MTDDMRRQPGWYWVRALCPSPDGVSDDETSDWPVTIAYYREYDLWAFIGGSPWEFMDRNVDVLSERLAPPT